VSKTGLISRAPEGGLLVEKEMNQLGAFQKPISRLYGARPTAFGWCCIFHALAAHCLCKTDSHWRAALETLWRHATLRLPNGAASKCGRWAWPLGACLCVCGGHPASGGRARRTKRRLRGGSEAAERRLQSGPQSRGEGPVCAGAQSEHLGAAELIDRRLVLFFAAAAFCSNIWAHSSQLGRRQSWLVPVRPSSRGGRQMTRRRAAAPNCVQCGHSVFYIRALHLVSHWPGRASLRLETSSGRSEPSESVRRAGGWPTGQTGALPARIGHRLAASGGPYQGAGGFWHCLGMAASRSCHSRPALVGKGGVPSCERQVCVCVRVSVRAFGE